MKITKRKLGFASIALFLIIVVLGHIHKYGGFDFGRLIDDLYSDIGITLLGVAVTVLIIDTLNDHRATELEKNGYFGNSPIPLMGLLYRR